MPLIYQFFRYTLFLPFFCILSSYLPPFAAGLLDTLFSRLFYIVAIVTAICGRRFVFSYLAFSFWFTVSFLVSFLVSVFIHRICSFFVFCTVSRIYFGLDFILFKLFDYFYCLEFVLRPFFQCLILSFVSHDFSLYF